VIELADQADALGIRRPYREGHPVHDAVRRGEAARVSAEDLPQSFVAALGEQMQIHFAQCGQEAVRVGHVVDMRRFAAGVVADLESVIHQIRERQRDREKASLDVLEHIALAADQGHHLDSMGPVGPHHRVVAVFVGAQDRMRVVVLAGQQAVQVGRRRPQVRAGELVGPRHFRYSLRSSFSRWSAGI